MPVYIVVQPFLLAMVCVGLQSGAAVEHNALAHCP